MSVAWYIVVVALLATAIIATRVIDSEALQVIKDDPPEISYFWHITDPHIDFDMYKEGTNPYCSALMCCHDTEGMNATSPRAGKFGFIEGGISKCDIPLVTFKSTLDFIKNYPIKPEFVFLGGDIPGHAIWTYTQNSTVTWMRIVHETMKDILGKEYLVLSAIGNHDAAPIDQFDTAPRYSWYLDAFAQEMSFWLPAEVIQQMRYAGHYTYLIRPKFRALVINTQYADVLNFYIYKNITDNDPGKLIATTTAVLTAAEKAGERVIILGHIPPRVGTSLWAQAVVDLGKRFSKTLIAHLYGHTHHDEFNVIRDAEGAYSMSYTAPAITTWSNQYPSIRLFKLNKTNNEIVDYVHFYSNTTESNLSGKMTFKLEYSAKSAYKLPDMSAKSWESLAQQFLTDEATFNQWAQHFNAMGDNGMYCRENRDCRIEAGCFSLWILSDDYDRCIKTYKR